MRRSTSQSATTFTGETWSSLSKSHFPYHPQPIRPTRFSAAISAAMAPGPLIHEAKAPALVAMNRRLPSFKFMGLPYAGWRGHLA
jgi:hypothetical protein